MPRYRATIVREVPRFIQAIPFTDEMMKEVRALGESTLDRAALENPDVFMDIKVECSVSQRVEQPFGMVEVEAENDTGALAAAEATIAARVAKGQKLRVADVTEILPDSAEA